MTDRTSSTETTASTRTEDSLLTVGQVAEQFGVTVRTLHHYDEVGLLIPVERSAAGYRLYAPSDITTLQHIVVYRRLGFGLEEIAVLLDRPETVEHHLRRQRSAVLNRLEEMRDLVAAIDNALEREGSGMKLTKQEQKELFGDGYSEEYAAEAQERWGDTDAWTQSKQRTAQYSAEDWLAIKAEQDVINQALAAALRAGLPAGSDEAMRAAEAHRAHIERWYYDLSHELHRNLGDMYVADPRFTQSYDDLEPGLAQFVRDAIHANADRRAE